MAQTTFVAPEIECGGCARSIARALERVEGIEAVVVDVEKRTVVVTHDLDLVSVAAILTRLDHAGFPAVVQ